MKYIDMHCDTILKLRKDKEKGLRDNDLHLDLLKMRKSNYMLQCFAMFTMFDRENSHEVCLEMIDRFYQELEKNKDLILPVLNYQDIINNEKNKKMSAMLTIEEGGATLCKLEHLRNFYRLGVRMITLTWNFQNGIGFPNKFIKEGEKITTIPDTENGLTEFGIEMVKEMERLGMIIDVSHLSDKGFYDVLKHTTKPFVASHSNARNVCSHTRNMTDDMILKLAARGGVMGMNYCGAFVDGETKVSTVKGIVKHIDYIVKLAGIDVMGLGSDFDGIEKEIEIKDASFMYLLYEELKQNGYSEVDIEKIMFRNVLRVFKEVLSK